MNQLFKYFLLGFLLLQAITTYADGLKSLTLTPAEMQKLKKYFPDESSDHLVWAGNALEIKLPIGKEKRLLFPSTISVDVKGALNTDQINVLNNDKSLYLTAQRAFSKTRIFITLKNTGEVILLDLVTDESTSAESQYVETKKQKDAIHLNSTNNINNSFIENNSFHEKEFSYVELIRYAWQQSYAPENLIKNLPKYSRAPMKTKKFISGLVYGDKVIAFPQASWLLGNHYVTAVLIRNKYPHPTKIDITKDLCGQWQAATIHPRSNLVAYKNEKNDSAILFLISSRPFGEVMRVCYGNA